MRVTNRSSLDFELLADRDSAARSRVLECTTFGMSRQMRATSIMGPVLEGSVSAVGQNPAISS